MDLYNESSGLRHRNTWTYFSVLSGLLTPQ